jgi:PAN domain
MSGHKQKKTATLRSRVPRLSCLTFIACGIVLFLIGVVFLALRVHKVNNGSYKHFSVNVAAKSVLSYLHGEDKEFPNPITRRNKKSAKKNNAPLTSAKKRSPYGTWLVMGSIGVIVREHASLKSKVIGELPTGAVVIADSSSIVTLNSAISFDSTRILITYPLHGWVSIKTVYFAGKGAKIHRYLKPLQFMSLAPVFLDKQCSADTFLQNIDLKGGDIESVEQPVSLSSAGECCQYCLTHEDCSAWTFTEVNTCWLKDRARSVSNRNTGLTSGLLERGRKKIRKIVSKEIEVNSFAGSNRISAACCDSNFAKGINGFQSTLKSMRFRNDSYNSNPETPRSAFIQESSPYAVNIERSTTDWTEQWPIGTGKFGALVGGVMGREVIPLSIGGLFVIKDEEDIVIPLDVDEVEEREGEDVNRKPNGHFKANFLGDLFHLGGKKTGKEKEKPRKPMNKYRRAFELSR